LPGRALAEAFAAVEDFLPAVGFLLEDFAWDLRLAALALAFGEAFLAVTAALDFDLTGALVDTAGFAFGLARDFCAAGAEHDTTPIATTAANTIHNRLDIDASLRAAVQF